MLYLNIVFVRFILYSTNFQKHNTIGGNIMNLKNAEIFEALAADESIKSSPFMNIVRDVVGLGLTRKNSGEDGLDLDEISVNHETGKAEIDFDKDKTSFRFIRRVNGAPYTRTKLQSRASSTFYTSPYITLAERA